jgi:hypothetical protein
VTKDEMIDAAVAVIEERARKALDGQAGSRGARYTGYTEARVVATVLREQGVLTHPHQDSEGWQTRESARKSLDGKARRLLDTEASKPNARILRFSSARQDRPPHLNGERMGLYGHTVAYTTTELFARATALAEQAEARDQADELRMDNALEQAAALGLPAGRARGLTITFTVDEFVTLLKKVVSG